MTLGKELRRAHCCHVAARAEVDGFPERTVAGTLSITVTSLRVIKRWVELVTASADGGTSTRGKHFPPRRSGFLDTLFAMIRVDSWHCRRSPEESENPSYVSRKLAVVPERSAAEGVCPSSLFR